jgi:pimeloyl-ACP methyl ester carboxylesterase
MTSAPFWSLGDAAERIEVVAADGARLPLYRLEGPARAAGLLVAHANGLAAGSYGPWLSGLARDFRVFAFDARGHGGSTWPPGPLGEVFAVDRLAEELELAAAFVRNRLGDAPLYFAGHSLGAASAVRLALDGKPLPFEGATLFEPPIFPPPGSRHRDEAIKQQERLVRGSFRRERHWESPTAFEAHLRERGVFRTFEPALLRAHCQATLRPEEDHYVLCCPPEVESAVFASHRDADTWDRLGSVRTPFRLVSGDPSIPERDWVTGAMASIGQGLGARSLDVVAGAGHMMIFQQPERCAALLRGHLGT